MEHLLEAVAQDLAKSNPGILAEDFKRLMMHARVSPYQWGVVFSIGNDVHIHILEDSRRRVYLRPVIKRELGILFGEYQVLKTSVGKDKPHALEFDKRMGWKVVSETPEKWNLEMTKEDFDHVWK